MPQINLLKQTHRNTDWQDKAPSLLVKIFAVVLLVVIGYYIYLFLDARSLDNQTTEVRQKISSNQNKILNFNRHDELITRQGQLKELTNILQNHIYWTSFLPELAKVTLKTASYFSLNVLSDGNMALSVSVPDYRNVDKFIQVFDQPEFNKYFDSLRVGGVAQVQNSKGLVTTFDAKFKFNTEMLKYNFGSNSQ